VPIADQATPTVSKPQKYQVMIAGVLVALAAIGAIWGPKKGPVDSGTLPSRAPVMQANHEPDRDASQHRSQDGPVGEPEKQLVVTRAEDCPPDVPQVHFRHGSIGDSGRDGIHIEGANICAIFDDVHVDHSKRDGLGTSVAVAPSGGTPHAKQPSSTVSGPEVENIEQVQAPCAGGIAIGGGTANGGNCAPEPNAAVIIYAFNGDKKTIRNADLSLDLRTDTPEHMAFLQMKDLEQAQDWKALNSICEEWIKRNPNWLTPRILAAKTLAISQDKEKACEYLKYVDSKTKGNTDYEVARALMTTIDCR
jgi:hypothetical protein